MFLAECKNPPLLRPYGTEQVHHEVPSLFLNQAFGTDGRDLLDECKCISRQLQLIMSRKTALSEDELLQRRIAHSRWLAEVLADSTTAAALSVAAYADILDDVILDAAIEARRDAAHGKIQSADPGNREQKRRRPEPLDPLPGSKGYTDVFGQSHPPSATEAVACQKCGRKVQAGKFAYHLEKCLGKGRQQPGRQASRRNGT